MEKNNPISDLMQESMAKLRELADTNTIFGKKQPANPEGNLGSGLGVGVHIDPVAFLIVKDGYTRVMPVAAPPMNTVDRVIEMTPEVIDRVTGFIEKQQDKKKAAMEEC